VLRPEDRADQVFSEYHRAHRRAAAEQDTDAPAFHLPAAGDRYPRSSWPALEAAAWALDTDPGRFAEFDLSLFEAFFGRSEDVSDPAVLIRLARAGGLDAAGMSAALTSRRYQPRVRDEHLEAVGLGIHGIPAFLIPGQPPIVGAVPYVDLTRAVDRALGIAEAEDGGSSKPPGVIQEGTAFL
jgi:predicted DsbA family dithiol-disulfide isomerase